jgi:hypothetical protein
MKKNDEDQVERRLKVLSQIEPSPGAAERAIRRAREALINENKSRQDINTGIRLKIFKNPIVKLAAAAVFLIAIGYVTGRLSTPKPLDVEELKAALEKSLKASLEPAIREDLVVELNKQWQSAFASNSTQLKEELQEQVRRDLTEFAAQTLAASGTLTNQRLTELVQLIEAARRRERQQIEAALEQIEQDKIRLENGLMAIAARTSEIRRTEQN